MSRRAVILAGGKGTRLRPYTVVLPKPLMPIGNSPILEIIIRQLACHGFDHISIAVNHQAELIQTFFGNGAKWKIKIDYSLEDKPLSTMGPLKIIKDLPDDFLVMNGDILTDLSYSDFFDEHVKRKNLFTVSSYLRTEEIDFGVLEVDGSGHLLAFKEKPVDTHEVSMGIYMANRRILELIPENTSYGFDALMLDLIKSKRPVSVKRYDGYWLDIGRPDDYAQAIDEFEKMKGRFHCE
jgi:NDP-sugar pyrophosphorylase family protein